MNNSQKKFIYMNTSNQADKHGENTYDRCEILEINANRVVFKDFFGMLHSFSGPFATITEGGMYIEIQSEERYFCIRDDN